MARCSRCYLLSAPKRTPRPAGAVHGQIIVPKLSSDSVRLEPRDAALPAVFGRFLAVSGPVVGMKAVRRLRVDHEFALLRRRAAGSQRALHLVDRVERDALIRPAVQAE